MTILALAILLLLALPAAAQQVWRGDEAAHEFRQWSGRGWCTADSLTKVPPSAVHWVGHQARALWLWLNPRRARQEPVQALYAVRDRETVVLLWVDTGGALCGPETVPAAEWDRGVLAAITAWEA